MAYHDDLKAALREVLPGKVVFMKDWAKRRRVAWRGEKNRPVGLMLHHTAAAATDSTSASAKGNQKGANNGVINFIQNHYKVPAANFTLDRDGTVYVHSAYAVWHAGVGSFAGKSPWMTWGIPKDAANDWMLGVEVVSKGLKKDFTTAQKESLALLIAACSNCSPDWEPLWLKNRPQHRDWTDRKIDLRYTNDEVKSWIEKYVEVV